VEHKLNLPAPGPIGVWRNPNGQPFHFDGRTSIPIDDPALDLPDGSSWTLEAWIYFPTLAEANIVGKRGICGGGDGFYQLGIGGNTPGKGMGVGSNYVHVNAWNHIAITMHGSSGWIVYANGSATKTVSAPGWRIQNTGQFRIGGSGTCKGFAGYIQEVSLYDRELSAEEIRQLYFLGMNAPITARRRVAPSSGAGALLGSTPPSGAAPSAGSAAPAAPSPGPVGVWRDPGGQPFRFDGRSSMTIDSPVVDLPNGSSWSLEAWVYPTSPSIPQHIAGKRGTCGAGDGFYQLAIGNNNPRQGLSVDANTVRTNAWNHLVVATNGDRGWTVYVDGVATKSVSSPGWRIENSAPFRIGAAGTCAGFKGDIQEVSLYDRELAPEEVKQLFLLGRNAPILASTRPVVSPSVPVATPMPVETASEPLPPHSLPASLASTTAPPARTGGIASAGGLDDAWIPQRRLALIIGNSRYAVPGAAGSGTWPDLEEGPLKDADAVATRLRALGFEVAEYKNQNIDQMNADLRAFADRIGAEPDALALFYYSGHGARAPRDIGDDGEETYLIPVATNLEYDVDAHSKAMGLIEVRNVLRRSRAGVVILDACRNNALRRPPTRAALTRGLAAPENISGMLFAYSTSAGDVADNRPGEMSEYTGLLVHELGLPGQSLTGAFRKVRKQIAQLHNSRLPELTDELNDDVLLVPAGAAR